MRAVFEVSERKTVVRNGRDIVHLSEQDFDSLIRGKKNCFICGLPAKKNKEHVIPDWVIRRCDLQAHKINLPKSLNHRFTTYTVPCCIRCNDTLARELEEPISSAFAAGFNEVKRLADTLDHRLYSWLNFLYFKTHYKDLFVPAKKRPGHKRNSLGDHLIWKKFRNPHAIVSAHIFGAYIAPSAIGSMKVLRVTDHEAYPRFAYKDAYENTCLYVRIDDIVIICALNDFGACKFFLEPFHSTLGGELNILQSLAVANEYEIAGRRLYGHWVLERELDAADGSIRLEGVIRQPMGMRLAPEQYRREGLRHQVEPFLTQNGFPPNVVALTMAGIDRGALTYIPTEAMQPLEQIELEADWQFLR